MKLNLFLPDRTADVGEQVVEAAKVRHGEQVRPAEGKHQDVHRRNL